MSAAKFLLGVKPFLNLVHNNIQRHSKLVRTLVFKWATALVLALPLSFTANAGIEINVSDVAGLTEGIIGANNNASNDTFTLKLTSDIVVESTAQGQGFDGNVLPFVRPQESFSSVVIDGRGHTISRSSTTTNQFRFIGAVGDPENNFRAKLTIKNLTLSNFELTNFSGGTLFVGEQADLVLENVIIENSRSMPSGSGGAIFSGGGLTIDRSTIRNSRAGDTGGAISASGFTEIKNSVFSNNTAATGAIFLNGVNSATIENSIISDNFSEGIFAIESNLSITASTVSGNIGSGIALQGDAPRSGFGNFNLTLLRSTISGNTSGSGSAVDLTSQSAKIVASTITANDSRSGLFVRHSDSGNTGEVRLSGSIVSGNTGRDSGGGARPNEIQCLNGSGESPVFNIITEDAKSLIGDNRVQSISASEAAVSSSCRLGTSGGNAGLVFAASDGVVPTAVRRILKPLEDNGCIARAGAIGLQQCVATHALTEGSPALELAIGLAGPDQRGFPEIGDKDAGAFEGFIADENCYAVKSVNSKVFNFCL